MKCASINGAIKQVSSINKWMSKTNCQWLLLESLSDIENKDYDFYIQANLDAHNENTSSVNNIDFYIQTNLSKPKRREGYFKDNKFPKPVLILENPLIRDVTVPKPFPKGNKWIHLGWNSYYYDTAIWPYDPSNNRWDYFQKQFNLKLHPWSRRGEYILFLLQKPGDSSLNRIYENGSTYLHWCVDTLSTIREITSRPILIRAHPLSTPAFLNKIKENTRNFKNIFYSSENYLSSDLNNSWCAVAYNSTATVTTSLQGIPTFVGDTSAASTPVASRNLEIIEKSFPEFDRDEWMKKLVFNQWQTKELNQYVLDLYLDCIPK